MICCLIVGWVLERILCWLFFHGMLFKNQMRKQTEGNLSLVGFLVVFSLGLYSFLCKQSWNLAWEVLPWGYMCTSNKRSIWDLVWKHLVLGVMILYQSKSSTWDLVWCVPGLRELFNMFWVFLALENLEIGDKEGYFCCSGHQKEYWSFKLKITTRSHWVIVH